MNKTPTLVLWALLLLNPVPAWSRSYYQLRDFDMRISGSSNLRDWDARAAVVHLDLALAEPEFGPDNITGLELRVPIATISTGTAAIDRNMHRALKAREHPEIIFKLESFAVRADDRASGLHGLNRMVSSGTLRIAGVTRKLELTVYVRHLSDDQVFLRGSRELLMTDFNIDPPSALLGIVRARDRIRVDFSLWLERKQSE